MNGVSSNIMMGQLINSGTGMCSLGLDEELLIPSEQDEIYENNLDNLLIDDNKTVVEGCTDDDFNFTF